MKKQKQTLLMIYVNKNKEMISYCYSICKNIQMAEDIIQNLFLKLLIKNDLSKISSLNSYIFKCIKLNTYNQLKINTNRNKILDKIFMNGAFSCLDNKEKDDFLKIKIIEDSIKSLPEKRGKIFVMKRLEHKSLKEISKELSISAKTVENHITNARRDLKIKLAQFKND